MLGDKDFRLKRSSIRAFVVAVGVRYALGISSDVRYAATLLSVG
jgi:hypothetical protein